MAKSRHKCRAGKVSQLMCYQVERVKRGKKSGYITFFKVDLGPSKLESYSGSRADRETCQLNPDPFQATIRKSKAKAERVGRKCVDLVVSSLLQKHEVSFKVSGTRK